MPFTAVSATDRSEADTVQCIRKRMSVGTVTSGTNITVGVLPPGAVVIGGGILTLTVWNSSGTDLMDVGATVGATNTVQVFASAIDVAALGLKAFDDLNAASANNYNDTAEVTVTAKYTGSVVDATTGVSDIIVQYVTKPVV